MGGFFTSFTKKIINSIIIMMDKKRLILKNLIFIVILGSLMVLSGCSTFDSFRSEFLHGGSDNIETVKIGVFEPLTGADKDAAKSEIQGIELAYSMYPTVDGKRVELVYADNRSDMNVAETAITDLIAQKPVVILGSYGEANSLTASEYIDDAKIPTIAITNTNPLITSTSQYYFRICFVDTYQGEALARFAYATIEDEKVAVMVDSKSEQSAAIAQKFISTYNKLKEDENAVALNLEYEAGSTDFAKQLKKLKNHGIKKVFLPATQEDAQNIISQAREMNSDIQFLGIDAWDSQSLVNAIGSAAASSISFAKVSDVEVADVGNHASEDFLECYASKYGDATVPDSSVALGYDAYLVALKAIEETGSDASGGRIKNAIMGIRNYDGVSGNISFDRTGNPKKSVTIYDIDPYTGESIASYIVEVNGDVIPVNKYIY